MQNINDRGAKKWARLTIPEFKESLTEIYQQKVDPKSAEQIEIIESLIRIVSGSKTRVTISYNPEGTTYQMHGYILNWSKDKQTVDIINDYGEQKELKFPYLQSIQIEK